jgi:3-oxoacid CoA-transferase
MRVVAARAQVQVRHYTPIPAVSAGFSDLKSVPGPGENIGTPVTVKPYTEGGKLWPSADEAIKDCVVPGALVLSAGFGLCGTAESLITAIVDRPDITDLTVVSNNAGNMGAGGLCEFLLAFLHRYFHVPPKNVGGVR